MKQLAKLFTVLSVFFLIGCAIQPPVQVISRECLWATQFQWTTEEANQIIDCCPQLAQNLLTHNMRVKEICP